MVDDPLEKMTFEDSTFDTISKDGSPWTTSGNVNMKKNGGPFGYDNSVVIGSDSSITQKFKGEPNKEYVVAAIAIIPHKTHISKKA